MDKNVFNFRQHSECRNKHQKHHDLLTQVFPTQSKQIRRAQIFRWAMASWMSSKKTALLTLQQKINPKNVQSKYNFEFKSNALAAFLK